MQDGFVIRGGSSRIEPESLLESLHDHASLAKFSLALYCRDEGLLASRGRKEQLCGVEAGNPLCNGACGQEIRDQFRSALAGNESRVFRCSAGLFSFFVPFQGARDRVFCLVGGAVRDRAVNLTELEDILAADRSDGITLLEEWESLPEVEDREVQHAARKVEELLPSLQGEMFYARTFEKTVMLINAVSDLFPAIDASADANEAIGLLSETLTVLFDVPRIALLLPDGDGRGLVCRGLLGDLPERLVPDEGQATLFDWSQCRRFELSRQEVRSYFPHLEAERLIGFPLVVDGQASGCLALFDVRLSSRDRTMVELLADKTAAKLYRLEREQKRENETRDAERLFELFTRLAKSHSRQELFDQTLHMAAGLLKAGKGSLMLLDEYGEKLSIVASLGMNPTLAKAMLIRAGEGIAGKVVQTGHALVVHDIEQDKRIDLPKRPRFESKSLISLPLKHNDQLLGVMNLSDKHDGTPFTEYDVRLLSRFAEQACGLISQVSALERTGKLEKLAVTDPLTGLYNRRLLEERLAEELSRCRRHGQLLSVMLVDLDFFKEYNDLCGHLAGDKALKRIAELLRKSARSMDVVTRFGGEEFCLLLPNTSAREALMVGERVRRAIEKAVFPHEESLPNSRLTTSVGIADFARDRDEASSLIHAADMALYQAKHAGRNRVILYAASEDQSLPAIS